MMTDKKLEELTRVNLARNELVAEMIKANLSNKEILDETRTFLLQVMNWVEQSEEEVPVLAAYNTLDKFLGSD